MVYFQELEEAALGLGYTPAQFETMQLRTLFLKLRWHDHQQQIDLEARRNQAFIIAKSMGAEVDESHWPLPWDEQKATPTQPDKRTDNEKLAHNQRLIKAFD